MPKKSRQSREDVLVGSWINSLAGDLYPQEDMTAETVEWKLRKFGLDRHEVELVMLRIIDGKKMTEVVKDQGWVSISSANYYLKKALKKLRDGGFKLR